MSAVGKAGEELELPSSMRTLQHCDDGGGGNASEELEKSRPSAVT